MPELNELDMDLMKARRLLNKIQAFLDNGNGHNLSRLEKDLLKSYVQQLYDAVTFEQTESKQEESIQKTFPEATGNPTHFQKPIEKAEPVKPSKPETAMHPPKMETPVYKNHPTPAQEKEIELEIKKQEPVTQTSEYNKPVVEPAKETVHAHTQATSTLDQHESLQKLFDAHKEEDSRFAHVQIESIESAMGLNERIFTLNELFGGDKGLFDAWCAKLNHLQSFAEAKNVLMAGPAKDFKWSEPERIKMAQQFLRIVSRRYPRSAT